MLGPPFLRKEKIAPPAGTLRQTLHTSLPLTSISVAIPKVAEQLDTVIPQRLGPRKQIMS